MWIFTDDPICSVENCGTIPFQGTAVDPSLLIIIETPRGCESVLYAVPTFNGWAMCMYCCDSKESKF